jgi:transcriptional regulator
MNLTERKRRQMDAVIRSLMGEDRKKIAEDLDMGESNVYLLERQALRDLDEMHGYWGLVSRLAGIRPQWAQITEQGHLRIRKASDRALGYAEKLSIDFDPGSSSLILSVAESGVSVSGEPGQRSPTRTVSRSGRRRFLSVNMVLKRNKINVQEVVGFHPALFLHGSLHVDLRTTKADRAERVHLDEIAGD